MAQDRSNLPIQRFNSFRETLFNQGILRESSGKTRRISLWRNFWSDSLESEFNYFLSYIPDPEELWYCLKSNILPITPEYLCPVCHVKYLKFTGSSWRTTCESCSPNQVQSKILKQVDTIKSFSPEQREAIKSKTKQTLLETYGDSEYNHIGSESYKANLLKKYGNPEYRNQAKIRQTCQEKYGVSTNLLTPESKEKSNSPESIQLANQHRIKTNLARYNYAYPSQVPEIRDKMQATKRANIQKFMSENDCTLVHDLYNRYGQGWISLEIEYIVHNGNVYVPNKYLPAIQSYSNEGTHTNKYTSKDEKDVASFIKSLGFAIEENNTNQVSNHNHRFFELDIYVPDKHVAFDYNGMYWHSSLFKDRQYHARKSECCSEAGIHLVHIFEDFWYSKQSIYKSIIKSYLGIYDRRIYARKCLVREINQDQYRQFLENNHLQGSVNSSLRLGLFYNDELVQVAGWGRSRFNQSEIELHRMCSALNTQVIGGFSKLIKASNLNEFISYIDLSVHDGHSYLASGFHILDKTGPGYFYYKDGVRYSRQAFQKSLLPSKLEKFSPDLSEYENMLNNRYLRIYDSGNLKVIYRKEILI